MSNRKRPPKEEARPETDLDRATQTVLRAINDALGPGRRTPVALCVTAWNADYFTVATNAPKEEMVEQLLLIVRQLLDGSAAIARVPLDPAPHERGH
jgi:hypothetical protein